MKDAAMMLVEFLTARLDEDEAAASGLHDIALCKLAIYGKADPTWGWECDCGRPARVLAEVNAKRRILQVHETITGRYATWCTNCDNEDGYSLTGPCETQLLLALPYADHPDYRQEWKL